MTVEVLRHDAGLSWVIEEPLMRASHALADGGRVWFVDPVDVPEAMAAAAELGEPAGVLQLLDRHGRDCRSVAERLGVPRLKLPKTLPDTPFEIVNVLDLPLWREIALWWPDKRALVVSEVIGTAPTYAIDGGAAGIHPMLRALPPGAPRRHAPEHLLVGHGAPVNGPQAATALEHAYARSRRDIPRLLTRLPRLARAANQASR